MCSTANFVLPLRRTCEVVAVPGRLCGGVSMTSMFPGPRSHGAPQDTDMDLAWQELMAITELREFGGISEGSYESTHYQTIEPMAPVGEYEPASSHPPHPPATCELNSSDIYSTSYSEVVRNCQHHGSNKGLMYGLTEPQQSPKLLLTSSPQPSLVTRRDFINMSDTNQEHRRANVCHSWGFGPNMRWASQGQPGQTDDIESDSGLSLDSSPPLASPDNPVCALGYQNKDISLTYRVGESDAMISITKEVRTLYPIECQSETTEYLQTGAHLPFVSFQPSSSQFQGSTLMSHSVKPQSQAAALCDIYSDAAMSSRQKSPLKPQGNISTPASLSRDERRALALKIPFPMEKIVNLPVDDFNELLTQYTLTDTQMALVRDIRRRGKNKVAAQNCRKRKLESIIHLERELNQLKTQKERMVQERLKFQHSLTFIKCCLTDLYAEVFSQLRDEKGQSYSTDEYFLQQTLDGKFYLVPHTMH